MTAFFALALVAAVAPECDPVDPTKCSTAITKGAPAPFDGQLLTTRLAIALGQKANGCDEHTRLELDRAGKLAAIDAELWRKLRAGDEDRHARELALVQGYAREQIEAAEPAVYERPLFVAALTATVFALAVWGAGQLR